MTHLAILSSSSIATPLCPPFPSVYITLTPSLVKSPPSFHLTSDKSDKISDSVLTLNLQWRTRQRLNDLSLKVLGEPNLAIISPVIYQHSKQKPMLSQQRIIRSVQLYSLHTL